MSPESLTLSLAPYGVNPQTRQAWPPLPTQDHVLEWVDRLRSGTRVSQGVPTLYLQHGVNSGGTRGVLAPVLEMLLQYPGIRVLDGRKDFNDLRLSIMETFFEIMPPLLIAERDEQEHRYVIRAEGGVSTIFFRELKDIGGLGSQEFSVIVVHEAHEITHAAYLTLKQRCRQQGYPNMMLMEGNPPSEGHWLDAIQRPRDPSYDPDLTILRLSSYENREHMPVGYLETLEAMPASWRKRYLLGETGPLPDGTPVYPAFVEAVHVRPTALIPDRPVLRFWDFGFRRPACVWAQRSDAGHVIIQREWLALETPETLFIDQVIERTNAHYGERVCEDFGDPAATQRDKQGVSTLRRLKARGIRLTWRQTTFADRIPLVNRKLSELVAGEPAIQIDPSCRILIDGLAGGYHYPELTPEAAFTKRKDEPFKDGFYEHCVNCLEYGLVNLFLGGSSAQRQAHRLGVERRRKAAEHRQGVVSF